MNISNARVLFPNKQPSAILYLSIKLDWFYQLELIWTVNFFKDYVASQQKKMTALSKEQSNLGGVGKDWRSNSVLNKAL
jgi:hypothetical protein